MPDALLLTASDFAPLRDDLAAMDGAIDAVERATLVHHQGRSRQGAFFHRAQGADANNSYRLSIAAGEGIPAGLRMFGNPPNTRCYMLLDGPTLHLLSLMDYGVLNSMRVGAIGGLAARTLAPEGARTVGMLGSGWQAHTQVQALRRALPGLDLIRVYSKTPANRESFARRMSDWVDIRVEAVDSAEAAIRDADIVDIVAPGHFDKRELLFDGDWIKPGALVIAMAPNQTDARLVQRSRVVAATVEGIFGGESYWPPFGQLIESGRFTETDLITLGSVIQDGVNPRREPDDIVLYELENTYVHDLFIAAWGYEWAKPRGLGKAFDLSA
jgi:ornithine cyclodeaminase/alanine dehydrogenase-like protein (mu-crystallin family)